MMSVLPAVLGRVIFINNNKLVLQKAQMTNKGLVRTGSENVVV